MTTRLPLFKQLDTLPHPPAQLVNDLIDQWIQKYKTLDRVGEFPNLSLKPSNELLNKKFQRISTFDPIQHAIGTWLLDNVFKNKRLYSGWIFRVNHIHSQKFKKDQLIEIYEKHLDSRYSNPALELNNYVLIYNLTDSIGDFVIYQESGKPLIREHDRPVYQPPVGNNLHQQPHETLKFENCIEIERHSPAPRTWYVSRIDAIHSVENSNQIPRAALQIRLTEKELEELISK